MGAGPVGLFLGLSLARKGVEVLVLEGQKEIIPSPRALMYVKPPAFFLFFLFLFLFLFFLHITQSALLQKKFSFGKVKSIEEKKKKHLKGDFIKKNFLLLVFARV